MILNGTVREIAAHNLRTAVPAHVTARPRAFLRFSADEMCSDDALNLEQTPHPKAFAMRHINAMIDRFEAAETAYLLAPNTKSMRRAEARCCDLLAALAEHLGNLLNEDHNAQVAATVGAAPVSANATLPPQVCPCGCGASRSTVTVTNYLDSSPIKTHVDSCPHTYTIRNCVTCGRIV